MAYKRKTPEEFKKALGLPDHITLIDMMEKWGLKKPSEADDKTDEKENKKQD